MAELANRASTPVRNVFSDLFGWDPLRAVPGYTGPGFDVQRTENGFDIELPVAGFRPEQINVTLDNGVLTISGESERRKFTRTLVLPDEIDPESVSANVEHGMLTLRLQLHPKAQPRKISVNTNATTPSAN